MTANYVLNYEDVNVKIYARGNPELAELQENQYCIKFEGMYIDTLIPPKDYKEMMDTYVNNAYHHHWRNSPSISKDLKDLMAQIRTMENATLILGVEHDVPSYSGDATGIERTTLYTYAVYVQVMDKNPETLALLGLCT